MVGLAIGLAQPQRAYRLSLVGEDWITARNRVKRFRHAVRSAGFDWHDAWHREPNPSGSGESHVHGWQRGDYVPQALLQELCHSVGLGIPYIEQIKSTKKSQTYGLKGIPYGLKLTEAEDQAHTYLDANGGRLAHASRGFWLDQDGQPTGIRAAMKAAARALGQPTSDDEGQWVLVQDGRR